MRISPPITALALLAGISLAVGGCGSNSLQAGYGTLKVSVTDGPIDLSQVNNLFVTFDQLYVYPAADSLPADSSGAPISVLDSDVTLDVLSLGNGLTTLLGTVDLPEGDYHSMTIVVDPGKTWLIESDGDSFDVKVPSNRIKIIADFTVTEGQVSDIVLDFDAAASLIQTGNGVYILRPVIHQLPSGAIGASISGSVMVQTGSGLVSAGDVMVPNPWLHMVGSDHGTGERPGDRDGHARRLDRRASVPLSVAWPMIVSAAAVGDLTPDDGEDHPAFSRTTLVDENGNYTLWRLRRGGTYDLNLVLNPASGYVIVSGPGTVTLNGDKIHQDFVIQAVVNTP